MENAVKQTQRKPHICLYIGSLQKGGAERVMSNLAEYLYSTGWQVTLVTTYFRPPEFALPHGLWNPETGECYAEETELVSWGNGRSVQTSPEGIRRIYSDPLREELERGRVRGFCARFRRLRAIWKQERPDVILSFIGYNNIFAILTSRGLRIPVAVSVRSNPSREYASAKLRLPAFGLFRQAAGVVLQTQDARSFFPKSIQKKAVVLPNAINPDFIRPRYEGTREKAVVSVGRLDANKNQDYLIRAFAKAHKEHPDYTLHLYGDGPMRGDFEALGFQLGIREAVVFEGIVDGVQEKIADKQIFVLPSREEGMPNALLEAMGAGLACISTDCPCGGPRDLIRDGINGFLVPVETKDPEQILLTKRLLQLMEDPDLSRRMGEEAMKVQEYYSPEQINGKWDRYLRSLMRHHAV